MGTNERETIAGWNPFAQLMAFLVVFIGMWFVPGPRRTLPALLIGAGFCHLTGGLIVLRWLARVPGARWWHYGIGGIVAAYLVFFLLLAIASLDPELGRQTSAGHA